MRPVSPLESAPRVARPARAVLLLLALLLALARPCAALTLRARAVANASDLPKPLAVGMSQSWDGIDGAWNTVPLRIGEPEQYTRAFVSTASQQTWAIDPEACLTNETDPNNPNALVEVYSRECFDRRGRYFNHTASKTWDDIGFFQLWLEKNLGLWGNGRYGYDTVGLGYTAADGPTLKNTTVGTLISENFWLGHLGINPKPTNFSLFSEPSPSYLDYLFRSREIPSLSWGYTAGAQYKSSTFLGSLTLGGYDTSRFIPNDLTFGFAPDNERDIVVGVVGINGTSKTKSNINLLKRDQFTMYIDSTVAELYLPVEVCQAIEEAWGLTLDNETGLYLVNDDLHEKLKAESPTITFSLGQKFSTNSTVDISLPYGALDLKAKPPYRGLQNESRYFPIRQAKEDNQFVLGRTFLQEAYLIVDWERQNFSVSACNWTYGASPNMSSIISPQYLDDGANGKSRLSTGAIIGIAIAGGFSFTMAVIAIGWWFWRRRRRDRAAKAEAAYASQESSKAKDPLVEKCEEESPASPIQEEGGTGVFPKAELPADGTYVSGDVKDGDLPAAEVDNTERQVFEMMGDVPARQEADGRQLSEKETMMVRERIYNGIDPNGPPASPTSEEPTRRPPPINPSEVTMVNRRLPTNVSPVTPRSPRDGASLEANDTFFQPPTRNPRDGRHLEVEDTLLSPISPLEAPTDRRRFSYES